MNEAADEIRALLDRRVEAIRNKDPAAAIACLAEDVVAFEMVPPLSLPPGAARDEHGFAAWLAGFEEINVDLHELSIEAGSEVGFARSLNHLSGTRVGGGPVDLWMRSTLCFCRRGAEWRIVHAHTSVPFYPGPQAKAALDLKPQP